MAKVRYRTRQELIDFLHTNPPKARRKFARGRANRCCLGHYADMCGIAYDKDNAMQFAYDDVPGEWRDSAPLPADHWLLQPSGQRNHIGVPISVQRHLAILNDRYGGWGKPIEFLESLDFG